MFAQELVKLYNFHTFDSVGTQVSSKKKLTVQFHQERRQKLFHLLFAAYNGDLAALEQAFLSGVDMNLADYDYRTALHLACAEDHLSCVKFLVETCKADLTVQDRWGMTPLQEALRCNRARVVTLLKKHLAKEENRPTD